MSHQSPFVMKENPTTTSFELETRPGTPRHDRPLPWDCLIAQSMMRRAVVGSGGQCTRGNEDT